MPFITRLCEDIFREAPFTNSITLNFSLNCKESATFERNVTPPQQTRRKNRAKASRLVQCPGLSNAIDCEQHRHGRRGAEAFQALSSNQRASVKLMKAEQSNYTDGKGHVLRFTPHIEVFHLNILLVPNPDVLQFFNSSFNKKIKDFQGLKTEFKYFQGLEIGLLKFKGFQDAYKPY